MFIETLEFTIPVDLCSLCTTLQKSTQSGLEFPASVNSYGTTQDASIQVALKANKLTFKVDGVSSNASIISKSECRTLKLSVFDVDRTLIPQENDTFSSNNVSNYHTSTSVPNSHKRTYEQSPAPVRAKIRRNSGGENKKNKSPNVDRVRDSYSNNKSKSMDNSLSNNVLVKTEPEDPDLIEIDPDPEPLKTEQPEQSSSCMYEQTSHSSYEQNVPHVQDYSEPGTSQQHRSPGQNVDDFLVFQDDSYENDDNEEYSNDDMGQLGNLGNAMTLTPDLMPFPYQQPRYRLPPRKNFPCPLCEKAFSDPCALNYHKEAIHEKKRFQCICGKVYKYRPGLLGHRKNCPVYQSQGQGHGDGHGQGHDPGSAANNSSYNRGQKLTMQVMPEPDNGSL